MRTALAAHDGTVSLLDDHIGRALAALRDRGFEPDTRVIYSSDHGDNLGTRSCLGRSTMYPEPAGALKAGTWPQAPAPGEKPRI